jgi:hypothetical protein
MQDLREPEAGRFVSIWMEVFSLPISSPEFHRLRPSSFGPQCDSLPMHLNAKPANPASGRRMIVEAQWQGVAKSSVEPLKWFLRKDDIPVVLQWAWLRQVRRARPADCQ